MYAMVWFSWSFCDVEKSTDNNVVRARLTLRSSTSSCSNFWPALKVLSGFRSGSESGWRTFVPQRSPLMDGRRQPPSPLPRKASAVEICVCVPCTLRSERLQVEWGAVSQAVADPILTHMCTISVGAWSLHGRAAECIQGSKPPHCSLQPVRIHARERQWLPSTYGCMSFHLQGGCSQADLSF